LRTIAGIVLLLLSIGTVKSNTLSPKAVHQLAFSPVGGFYHDALRVQLASGYPDSEIYYTLDGSFPTRKSTRYQKPIYLNHTAVVRAVSYHNQKPNLVCAETYFINEPKTDFLVASVAISPNVLFDPEKGWFIQGARQNGKPSALSRKEIPANVALFESGGHCVYNQVSGMRLFGGVSRLFPQKSLVIAARKYYGKKRIHHSFFGENGPKNFKYLVLRNAGSDFGSTHFRDPLIEDLVKDWDLDVQGYRPAHLYINGHYWGIYHLREKVNRYFVASHSDIDKDSVDLLEHFDTQLHGTRKEYSRMLRFFANHDLSQASNYAAVEKMMEIDNFIDYQIAQIYFDNRDAGGNIRFYRAQKPNARWRWILFDTDWGMGLHDPKAYAFNTLKFQTATDGPRWPNPPWSTFLLRKLLTNPNFKTKFINRFADYLSTSLTTARVSGAIDQFHRDLRQDMPRHLERWNLSEPAWIHQIDRLCEFAALRPAYMQQFLKAYFDAGDWQAFKITASPGGKVLLNKHLTIGPEGFSGSFLSKIPIQIQALPALGYRFSHWEGVTKNKNSESLALTLENESIEQVRPVFQKFPDPRVGLIVINEVSPTDKAGGDWLELYNSSNKTVSLGGWQLQDGHGRKFQFPAVNIPAHDYLVICQDAAKLLASNPDVYNYIGGLTFGLSKHRETLQILTPTQVMVDSMGYRLPATDSVFTYQLVLPELDNAKPQNWQVTLGSGSPNAPNPEYNKSHIRTTQITWARWGMLFAGFLLLGYYFYFKRPFFE